MKKIFSTLVALLIFVNLGLSQNYKTKHALVIGNTNYEIGPLKNPKNDAQDFSELLSDVGFEVETYFDINLIEMKEALRRFERRVSQEKGVALFYYSGHGLQTNGKNYLVPVDANISAEYEIEEDCMEADRVLRMFEFLDNPLNIVILDACRNNPFVHSYRSGITGLAQPKVAPTGSIVAFSTAPGKVASDGVGDNGLYTQELIKAIRMPGLSIEEVFKVTRRNVALISNKSQIPWENSSLLGDFYFVDGEKSPQYNQPFLYASSGTSNSNDDSFNKELMSARTSLFSDDMHAMSTANKILESDPENAEAYDIRHWTYKRIQQYEEAKADLDMAYELTKDRKLFLAYTYYYIDLREYSEAIKYLNKYFASFPEEENKYWNQYTKAEILVGLGDNRQARDLAEKVIDQAQNDPNGDKGYVTFANQLISKMDSELDY